MHYYKIKTDHFIILIHPELVKEYFGELQSFELVELMIFIWSPWTSKSLIKKLITIKRLLFLNFKLM